MNRFDPNGHEWVDLYAAKSKSITEEFVASVHSLLTAFHKEQQKSNSWQQRCTELEKEVQRLQEILYKNSKNSKVVDKIDAETSTQRLDIHKQRWDTSYSAAHNNAMLSEQLQMDTSGILSPGQRTSNERISETEWPSPTKKQHGKSPALKMGLSIENRGALAFVRATGRIGNQFQRDTLRDKNHKNNFPVKCEKLVNKDWLSKEPSKNANLKRSSTFAGNEDFSDYQWKRSLLTLNKSNDQRKMKQARLTQMQMIWREKQPDVSENQSSYAMKCLDLLDDDDFQADIPKFEEIESDEDFQDENKPYKESSCQRQTNTDNIFTCSDISSDENDENDENRDTNKEHEVKRYPDPTEIFPDLSVRLLDNDSPSVIVLPSPTPTLISLEDSNKVEESEVVLEKREELSERPVVKMEKKDTESVHSDRNIDSKDDVCYEDFKKIIKSCSRSKPMDQALPETPKDFWNPLMASFAQDDPRNTTLLEDPVLTRRRNAN